MEYFNGISYEHLVIRYAHNYGLKVEYVTIEMVLRHWELEKSLTRQLMNSTTQNRKTVFYNAYNTLYDELPWLRKTGSLAEGLPEQQYNERWLPILGDVTGKLIYEIGSGNGDLISSLSARGATCVGTEISENRLDKMPRPNLEWHNTDGVNLTAYEPRSYYDLVISDQVIEHLHPEDIGTHLKTVNEILKPGGRYIFYTPHYYIGPGDVSRIFGCAVAEGMHLKEYKYTELYNLLRSAAFTRIDFPVNLKGKTRLLSPRRAFLFLERSLGLITSLTLRKKIYHRLIRLFRVSTEIVIIAVK